MSATRQDDAIESWLDRDQVRLLGRLSRWRSAAELGVAEAALDELVAARCAFWSDGEPEQVLGGAPLGDLAGATLAGRVFVEPMLARGGRLGGFEHMPRLGTLDDALFGGVRLTVHEWETAIMTVVVGCCRRHAEVARDLVAGAPPDAEIAPILDELGLLERHAAPGWDGTPRVTWLVHAGILYEAAGARIAIDPLVHPRSEPTRHAVRPIDPRDLGRLDAVLITHGDSDHFQPEALVRLPRDTLVVIPRAAAPQPYHVDMRRVLDLLGFTRVREVDEWERVAIGAVTAVAAPFRGEDWGLPLPTRTWLVHSPALTIYANADALSDDAVLDRLAAEFAIDLAFVGVGGAAEAHVSPRGIGYGHFYAPWIPAERADQWVELCNGPRAAAAAARRLRARYAFGYAAGGAPFTHLAYSDRGTHAEMAAHLGVGPTRALPLQVGVPVTLD